MSSESAEVLYSTINIKNAKVAELQSAKVYNSLTFKIFKYEFILRLPNHAGRGET